VLIIKCQDDHEFKIIFVVILLALRIYVRKVEKQLDRIHYLLHETLCDFNHPGGSFHSLEVKTRDFFYGLAADRQEYCFTKVFFIYFILFFLKFFFEPQQLFFQIRVKNS